MLSSTRGTTQIALIQRRLCGSCSKPSALTQPSRKTITSRAALARGRGSPLRLGRDGPHEESSAAGFQLPRLSGEQRFLRRLRHRLWYEIECSLPSSAPVVKQKFLCFFLRALQQRQKRRFLRHLPGAAGRLAFPIFHPAAEKHSLTGERFTG